MNLLRVENERYVFILGPNEKDLFEIVLRLYPVVPSAHQRLSRTAALPDSSQHLLDEALAEQRKENKKQVEALLAEAGRFHEVAGGFSELALTPGEIEWVLQVLNDVRVGNWILLGSPEEHLPLVEGATNLAEVAAMELAGIFQMTLLNAVSQGS